MSRIEWVDNFEIGIEILDEDHRQLVDIVNRLSGLLSSAAGNASLGDLIDEAVAYMEGHFTREEAAMAQYCYPDLEKHRAAHEKGLAGMRKLQTEFRGGAALEPARVLHFLHNWLINHFLGADAAFKRHLLEAGHVLPAGDREGLLARLLGRVRVVYRVVATTVIPILALMALSGAILWDKWKDYENLDVIHHMVADFAPRISGLVHEMQKERGNSAGFIGSKGAKFSAELAAQRKVTDGTLAAFRKEAAEFVKEYKGQVDADFLSAVDQGIRNLDDLASMREGVSALGPVGVPQMAKYYTGTIASLLHIIELAAVLSPDERVTTSLAAYTAILQGKERAGIERAMGSAGFGAKKFNLAIYQRFVELTAEQEAYFDVFRSFATPAQIAFLAETVSGPDVDEVKRMREIAIDSLNSGDTQGVEAPYWFTTITNKINLLKKVEDRVGADVSAVALHGLTFARDLVIGIVTVLVVFAVVTVVVIFVMVRS
ncbi:MAG: bacteriohemerythrin, partial [Rhodospirillales bacterium]|nr:bacteriohemerythrin [Rhodospirillales bacterium]